MKLSVPDRLVLLQALPREGDLTLLRILRDLTSRLSFSEEELATLEFKFNAAKGQTEWKQNAVEDVEVLLGPKAHAVILEAFEALAKEKKMPLPFLSTYDKFVEKEEGG